jgi:phosphoribosyl 1,2-cyclic phosphodiesterase
MSGLKPSIASFQPNDACEFEVRFWGVRGSVPTPSKETIRYGGNTACVELSVAGKRLIFDGGTGLRVLGKSLLQQMPVEAHIFFTHTQWDRIQGFPFFIPAFLAGNCFHIYGAMGLNGASIKHRLSEQMLRTNFPVSLQQMQSDLNFHNITPGSIIHLDDVTVETVSLNRVTGAIGFRIIWNGCSVVYATDTEQNPEQAGQSLRYLADQADLLIYNAVCADYAYYDPQAVAAARQSSTWQSWVEVAIDAKVKQVIMFHHDPAHDDDFLDQIETEMQSVYSNVRLAREGMVLQLDQDE